MGSLLCYSHCETQPQSYVLGCFSWQGWTNWTLYGSVTGYTYTDTEHLQCTAYFHMVGCKKAIQHSQIKSHSCIPCKQGLSNASLTCSSLDLNPIENLWAEIKQSLYKQ